MTIKQACIDSAIYLQNNCIFLLLFFAVFSPESETMISVLSIMRRKKNCEVLRAEFRSGIFYFTNSFRLHREKDSYSVNITFRELALFRSGHRGQWFRVLRLGIEGDGSGF